MSAANSTSAPPQQDVTRGEAHLVTWSDMKALLRRGMAAPTEKEMADVMHASHGLAMSSVSIPSSSRACASITALPLMNQLVSREPVLPS